MMNRVGELEQALEISESDLKELRVLRRQRILEKIAHVALPAISAVVGLASGNALVPVEASIASPYPFGPLIAAAPVTATSRRHSWMATIVVSLVLFIAAFVLIASINTGLNNVHGTVPKYGAYAGGPVSSR
jgi:hypothetical protein